MTLFDHPHVENYVISRLLQVELDINVVNFPGLEVAKNSLDAGKDAYSILVIGVEDGIGSRRADLLIEIYYASTQSYKGRLRDCVVKRRFGDELGDFAKIVAEFATANSDLILPADLVFEPADAKMIVLKPLCNPFRIAAELGLEVEVRGIRVEANSNDCHIAVIVDKTSYCETIYPIVPKLREQLETAGLWPISLLQHAYWNYGGAERIERGGRQLVLLGRPDFGYGARLSQFDLDMNVVWGGLDFSPVLRYKQLALTIDIYEEAPTFMETGIVNRIEQYIKDSEVLELMESCKITILRANEWKIDAYVRLQRAAAARIKANAL